MDYYERDWVGDKDCTGGGVLISDEIIPAKGEEVVMIYAPGWGQILLPEEVLELHEKLGEHIERTGLNK